MALFSQEAYLRAFNFAAERHLGQKVPGTEYAYLHHLSLVAMETLAAIAEEPVDDPNLSVLCSLLHDILEDTETTYEEVESRFGRAVADGVRALTKNPDLPKAAQMPDSLRRLLEQPREVQLVKLADRTTNLQPPPSYWTPEKVARYKAEAEVILKTLGPASRPLRERLAHKIATYPPSGSAP